MGISGHSVGGFVTNYTVTHTNKFKAAVSGAGISDMVRAATDLWGYGGAKQEFLKDAVYMMQADLPDDPQSYIRNSPILSSRNLTTPLLLLHCDNDGSVNFQQSRSFFIVLRSLQKPCWWLNYKGQTHGILGTEPQIDYNMKVIQFYDHFLKNKPMPDWMKEHI
jgi:dipeptidyl aminopeptidase/acylaminoacyl peptidase